MPKTTPPELLALCHARGATASPIVNDPNAPPAQKTPNLKTFEDKRRDNFDKGQAELDRRRQILMEEVANSIPYDLFFFFNFRKNVEEPKYKRKKEKKPRGVNGNVKN